MVKKSLWQGHYFPDIKAAIFGSLSLNTSYIQVHFKTFLTEIVEVFLRMSLDEAVKLIQITVFLSLVNSYRKVLLSTLSNKPLLSEPKFYASPPLY